MKLSALHLEFAWTRLSKELSWTRNLPIIVSHTEMIEGPKIAKESAGFPDPVKDGRICELCGGRTFSILHGWQPGNRWTPTALPIAVWKCTCGFTFLHPVPAADQLPDKGDWWSSERKVFTRK